MGSLNQHGLDEAGFPELCLSLSFPHFPLYQATASLGSY